MRVKFSIFELIVETTKIDFMLLRCMNKWSLPLLYHTINDASN